jgi:hypothetical protein
MVQSVCREGRFAWGTRLSSHVSLHVALEDCWSQAHLDKVFILDLRSGGAIRGAV